MRSTTTRRAWLVGLALGIVTAGAGVEGARYFGETTKPESKSSEGWWMDRHKELLNRIKKGNVDLLLIGDSITQGWEGEEGAKVWERYYTPRNAANLGIGGDRTEHVLWRLENGEVNGVSPKVAVVMIGTNNLGSNTPEEIADGVAAVVKSLREKLPRTKVLLLGVFPRGGTPDRPRDAVEDKTEPRIGEINERISKLDDGKAVKYLDVGKAFLNDEGKIPKSVMPDFLHLSRKGYMKWADAMEPTLWEMMEGK